MCSSPYAGPRCDRCAAEYAHYPACFPLRYFVAPTATHAVAFLASSSSSHRANASAGDASALPDRERQRLSRHVAGPRLAHLRYLDRVGGLFGVGGGRGSGSGSGGAGNGVLPPIPHALSYSSREAGELVRRQRAAWSQSKLHGPHAVAPGSTNADVRAAHNSNANLHAASRVESPKTVGSTLPPADANEDESTPDTGDSDADTAADPTPTRPSAMFASGFASLSGQLAAICAIVALCVAVRVCAASCRDRLALVAQSLRKRE